MVILVFRHTVCASVPDAEVLEIVFKGLTVMVPPAEAVPQLVPLVAVTVYVAVDPVEIPLIVNNPV